MIVNYHNFERTDNLATVFLKWTDFDSAGFHKSSCIPRKPYICQCSNSNQVATEKLDIKVQIDLMIIILYTYYTKVIYLAMSFLCAMTTQFVSLKVTERKLKSKKK